MSEIISRIIDENEILVRFVFKGDFKKNNIDEDSIIDKNIFTDTHNKGVSLQRERYLNENKCKEIAKENPNAFVGFVVFKKKSFDSQLIKHIELRQIFEADILSTPLDENLEVIPKETEVKTDTPLLPAHADLTYINPASTTDDDSPHTFKRVFSKNLYKESYLLLDENFDDDGEYIGKKFKYNFA